MHTKQTDLQARSLVRDATAPRVLVICLGCLSLGCTATQTADAGGDGPTTGDPTDGTDGSTTTTPPDMPDGTDDTTDDATSGAPEDPYCGDGQIDLALGEVCDDAGESGTCTAACVVKSPVASLGNRCAVLVDGRVKCWGANPWVPPYYTLMPPYLGDEPGEMGEALPALEFGDRIATSVSTKIDYDLCVSFTSGEVACLGHYYRVGLVDESELSAIDDVAGLSGWELIPVSEADMGEGLRTMEFGAPVLDVRVNEANSVCALLASQEVVCWGHRSWTGQGDNVDVFWKDEVEALPPIMLPEPVVALSDMAACAIGASGKLYCWGHNAQGELLLGDAEDRGDEPGEMGASLPAAMLEGGAVLSTTLIAGGSARCALMEDRMVRCWGELPSSLAMGLGDGIVGDEPGEVGAALPAFRLDRGLETVAIEFVGISNGGPLPQACEDAWAGTFSALCGILEDGSVKCFGTNRGGVLGQNMDACVAHDPLELPPIDLGEPAVELSGGPGSMCARLQSGRVKCWGANHRGQLGLGDAEARGDDPGEVGPDLPYVEL